MAEAGGPPVCLREDKNGGRGGGGPAAGPAVAGRDDKEGGQGLDEQDEGRRTLSRGYFWQPLN